MSAWTIADRDAIKAAILVAAVEGIASVSIGGQMVQARSLKELREMLAMVQGELAADNTTGAMGMRLRKTIPPAAG